MTTKSMVIQVRMPPRLVHLLDRMTDEGLYASRSEAILDSVRRLVIGYEKSDSFRRAIIRSYLGRKGAGSIDDITKEIDADEISSAIKTTFNSENIDDILDQVRR